MKEKMYLVHVAEKDVPVDCGLKSAKPGLENTIRVDIKCKNSELLDIRRNLDILSSMYIFEKSNVKHIRDLLESASE